mgnify:CR=1 FL=1
MLLDNMVKFNKIAILPEEIEEGDIYFNENVYQYKYLFIFLSKENGSIFLDKYLYGDNNFKETIIRDNNGEYKIEIFSIKNDLLEKFNFHLSNNNFYEVIVVPNYLNIGKINLYRNEIIIDHLSDPDLINFCNENGICEEGEKNICIIDCPQNANNPNYPLYEAAIEKLGDLNKQKEALTMIEKEENFSKPPEIPKDYFYNLLIFTVFGISLILLIFFIIIKKFKKING